MTVREQQNNNIKTTSELIRCDKPTVTKAVILVGGWGTRLRPLTYTIPKPLINFCNKPILKHQVEKLVGVGIKEIILALNYYSELIVEEVGKYEDEFGIKIVYSKEDSPLGTAGPLALVKDHLKGTSFFLLNSDIACNANLELMVKEYMESDSLGTILSYEVEDPTRYGLLNIKDGKIKSFLEKPKKIEGDGPWIINAGMYILSYKVLDYIELREMSIETEVFPQLAEKNMLSAFKLDGYWMDIGQPRDYLRGQKLALENECNKDLETKGIGYSLENGYIDKKNNVVVGKNVKMGTNVQLRNCVVFENAILEDNVIIEDSLIGWSVHICKDSKVSEHSVLGECSVVEPGVELRSCLSEPNSKITANK
jgi:mannose-1-phosphate guanylyltransferase